MSPRPTQIAVIGSSSGSPEALAAAEEVGRLLAEAGAVVVCGGRGGVMEAASRGASRAGGLAIGILPGSDPEEANEHVAHVVATGVGHARNLAVVGSGAAVIAVDGHWGTLSEIAFARHLGRTVVALRSWELAHRTERELGIAEATSPAQAVEIALAAVSEGAPGR